MLDENLKCRILTGARSRSLDNENFVYLSRVPFEYGHKSKDMMVRFRRTQFSIRLAFAITINKARLNQYFYF